MKRIIMLALVIVVGTKAVAEEYKYECKGSYEKCNEQSIIYSELTKGGLSSVSNDLEKNRFVAKSKIDVLMMVSIMSSTIENHVLEKHSEEMGTMEKLGHVSSKNMADRTLELKETLEKVSK